MAGLTGFAISQPLLSILGDEPTILAFYGVEGPDLVLLATLIALGPAVAVWALTRLVALVHPRAGRVTHLLTVLVLASVFTIQVAKAAGVESSLVLASVALGVGVAFTLAYVRTVVVATWASYTGALPLLAVVFFLAASPASALLGSVEEPERVTGSGEPTPVVLIILDELPTRSLLDGDDQIDAARFPNLAGFGADATWYRHHTTVATLTEAAVPSLLTGTAPTTDQALWTNHPDNLFTLLAPTHELEVLEQATELCPYDSCAPTAATDERAAGEDEPVLEEPIELAGPGLGDLLDVTVDLWLDRVSLGPDEPADLDDFAEEISEPEPAEEAPPDTTTSPSITVRPEPTGEGDPPAALTSARADALIKSFDADKGAALYYVHLILPHQPWVRYPDGESYDLVDPTGEALPLEDRKELFSWSPWTSAVSEQRHLLQAQYADSIVGQLLDGLRTAGLYDESLVIVTSDHGVSFESHTAGRYVEPTTADAIAYAPLLIKEPGQSEGRVDDTNVSNLDLLPTIADRLGLDVSWDVAGAPIGSPAIEARGDQKQIYDMIGFGGTQIRGIVEFDDRATFATVGERAIDALPDPTDPLSGLHARLGLPDLVGRRLDDLVTTSGGQLAVNRLDDLRHPPADAPHLGELTGRASGGDEARLVVAIDGVVVGGSLLSTDSDGGEGHVAVLLPQGALDGENEIRAALVLDDEVRELEVVST